MKEDWTDICEAEKLWREPTPEEEDQCARTIKRVLAIAGGLLLLAVAGTVAVMAEPLTLRVYENIATDRSGNGNDGIIYGGAVLGDGFLTTDGVDDHVDCNAIMVSNNDHTVTAWIKATSTAGISAKPIISQYAVGVSGRTRWIYGLNGYWRFINSGTSGANIISQTNIFIFIAITVESGTIIAYANGNPEFTVGGFDDAQATDMLFAKDNSDNYGDCVLSQTRIYGRAITPTEV